MGLLSYILNLGKTAEMEMNNTSLQDADIVYAADMERDMVKESAEMLQNEGYDITYFTHEDLEETEEGYEIDGEQIEALEDSTVFYAEESYLSGKREGRQENRDGLREVEKVADEFVNPVAGAELADDKLRAQQKMERHGINTPDIFRDVDDLNRYIEEGNTAVKKARKGSRGDGFELVEDDVGELDDEAIYQEAIDQTDENIEERRGFMIGDRPVAIEARSTGNDRIEPQNIAAGGEYSSVNEISHGEVSDLRTASRIFGEGITAVDYFKNTETGEITVLEANKTPYTGINSHSEEDVHEEVAKHLAATRGDIEPETGLPDSIQELMDEPELQPDISSLFRRTPDRHSVNI